jgi:hypothetical protein
LAQFRPFAIWDGISALPSGINQSQYILIGVDNQNYYNLGGFTWWAGPDESLGYVIAYYDPTFTHPNPLDIPAGIGFLRSDALTDISFLEVFNYLMVKLAQPTLSNVNDAKAWLLANGYWTSYGEAAWTYGDSGVSPSSPSTPSTNQTLYWTGGNPISVATQFAISANNTNQFSQIQSIYVNEISADANGNPAGNQAAFLMGLPAGTLIEITNTVYPSQNVIVEITSVTQLTSISYSINATYVSGSAMAGTQLFEFNFYTPTNNGGGGSGIGEWYFYSDEGLLNAMAPENNGNAIFLTSINNSETFNPNLGSALYFNIDDASGASHLTEFQNLVNSGGTFTMYQNGDMFEFSAAPNSGGFNVYTSPTSGWLQINIPNGTVGQASASTFTFADPITISISI